jgi:hypothetical protein
MKHCFQNIKLRSESLALIEQANEIIEQYQSAGYRMTLRQLYYQFVSKNLLANTERNYKRLGSILNDGRYAGLVDWGAIEDRNRQPHKIGDFTGLESLANAALASYRLDRWKGQNYFVELWVEKAALAGVLQPLADEWHATLMVNRGYSSASAMFEAANRFRERKGQDGIVLYLGDHDPSGEDMVRDIQSRFDLFQVTVDVRKVALTMDQIREHNPPPNPAKASDSRYDAYAAKHGIESWEVDALPPPVLEGLVRGSFQSIVTERELNAVLADERKDKKKFAEALDKATNGESEVDKRHLKVFKPPFE